tara:strand:- start:297 stop:494 length:198 start_codon:yes stop_codon:yes gene_type:complete
MTDISTYTTIAECNTRLSEIEAAIKSLIDAGAHLSSHEDYATLQLYLREQAGLQFRSREIEMGSE